MLIYYICIIMFIVISFFLSLHIIITFSYLIVSIYSGCYMCIMLFFILYGNGLHQLKSFCYLRLEARIGECQIPDSRLASIQKCNFAKQARFVNTQSHFNPPDPNDNSVILYQLVGQNSTTLSIPETHRIGLTKYIMNSGEVSL